MSTRRHVLCGNCKLWKFAKANVVCHSYICSKTQRETLSFFCRCAEVKQGNVPNPPWNVSTWFILVATSLQSAWKVAVLCSAGLTLVASILLLTSSVLGVG